MSVRAIHLSLFPSHGVIPLVVVGAGIVNMWASHKVGAARRKYNIPYPQMYAEKSDKDAKAFNCVQRAHQNFLEQVPTFYALLATGSIYRPKVAAAAGFLRIVGFVFYINGYASGDPKKRMQGAFGQIGTLVLLGLTIEASVRLLSPHA